MFSNNWNSHFRSYRHHHHHHLWMDWKREKRTKKKRKSVREESLISCQMVIIWCFLNVIFILFLLILSPGIILMIVSRFVSFTVFHDLIWADVMEFNDKKRKELHVNEWQRNWFSPLFHLLSFFFSSPFVSIKRKKKREVMEENFSLSSSFSICPNHDDHVKR